MIKGVFQTALLFQWKKTHIPFGVPSFTSSISSRAWADAVESLEATLLILLAMSPLFPALPSTAAGAMSATACSIPEPARDPEMQGISVKYTAWRWGEPTYIYNLYLSPRFVTTWWLGSCNQCVLVPICWYVNFGPVYQHRSDLLIIIDRLWPMTLTF